MWIATCNILLLFAVHVAAFGVPQPFFVVDSASLLLAHQAHLHHHHLPSTVLETAAVTTLSSSSFTLLLANNEEVLSALSSTAEGTIFGPDGPLGSSEAAQEAIGQAGDLLQSAGGILYNVAIGLTALVFVAAGLIYLVASVVIPAAAKELEKECLELAPDLWEEYQAKLGEGETMDKRPDLMQELGQKLQPLLDRKTAMQQQQQQQQGSGVKGTKDAIDATILDKQEDNSSSMDRSKTSDK